MRFVHDQHGGSNPRQRNRYEKSHGDYLWLHVIARVLPPGRVDVGELLSRGFFGFRHEIDGGGRIILGNAREKNDGHYKGLSISSLARKASRNSGN